MKIKRECKVVQDLLPNYIEKLTSEETNSYVNEHISSCDDCKKVMVDMQEKIKTSNPKRQEKAVKFFKKYNRKIRILSSIVIAIIIIYAVLLIRNIAILSSLTSKIDRNWNPNNMHSTIYSHTGGKFSTVETYYKGEKRLTEITSFSKEETINIKTYFDGKTETTYIEQNGNKTAWVRDSGNLLNVQITPHLYFENRYQLIFMAATSLITNAKCNGEDCYFINTWGLREYYSKESGLTIRSETTTVTTEKGEFNSVVDYEYEFETVKDEDLKQPDISQYKVIKN